MPSTTIDLTVMHALHDAFRRDLGTLTRAAAVLAEHHPLAAADEVHAAELADEPFVWVDEMDARVRDYWTLAEYRVGRPVKVGARISGFEDAWEAVRAGLAVAASPAIMLTRSGTGIVTRPIHGLGPATLGVCRRANDTRPLVTAFVDTATTATPGTTTREAD